MAITFHAKGEEPNGCIDVYTTQLIDRDMYVVSLVVTNHEIRGASFVVDLEVTEVLKLVNYLDNYLLGKGLL